MDFVEELMYLMLLFGFVGVFGGIFYCAYNFLAENFPDFERCLFTLLGVDINEIDDEETDDINRKVENITDMKGVRNGKRHQ